MKQKPNKPVKAVVTLIIQSSPDGKNDWILHMDMDTPEYVKDPDNLARLVDGEMVCFDPSKGYRWWRGVKAEDVANDLGIRDAVNITKGVS